MPASSAAARGRKRHRVRRRVRRAVGAVVDVVELAHGDVAGGDHLAVGEQRDRVDRVGVEPPGGGVHRLAPGPEVVAAGGRGRPARRRRACRAGRRGCARSRIPAGAARRWSPAYPSRPDARGIPTAVPGLVRRAGGDRPHPDGLEPGRVDAARGRGAGVVPAHGRGHRPRGAPRRRRQPVGGHARRRRRAVGVRRLAPRHPARRRRLRRRARHRLRARGRGRGARVGRRRGGGRWR